MGIYLDYPTSAIDVSTAGASCTPTPVGGSLVGAIGAVGSPLVRFSFPETLNGGSRAALRCGGFGFPPYNAALIYQATAIVTFALYNVSLGSAVGNAGMSIVTRVNGVDAQTYNVGFINNGTFDISLWNDPPTSIFDPSFQVELRASSLLAGSAPNTIDVDFISCRAVSATNRLDLQAQDGANAGQVGNIGVWSNPKNVMGAWADGTFAEFAYAANQTGDTSLLFSYYSPAGIPANANPVGFAINVAARLRNGSVIVSGGVRSRFYAALTAWNGNAETSPRTECTAWDVTGSANMTGGLVGLGCGGEGILTLSGATGAPAGPWIDYNGGCQPSVAALNAGTLSTLVRVSTNPGGNNQPIAGIDSVQLACWYDVQSTTLPSGAAGALQFCGT